MLRLGEKHPPEYYQARIRPSAISPARRQGIEKARLKAIGMKRTAESRAKQSASSRGKPRPNRVKPIVEYMRAHARLGKVSGLCRCGAAAREWALDPATPPERLLTSACHTSKTVGLRYSLTPTDYRPSCHRCNVLESAA